MSRRPARFLFPVLFLLALAGGALAVWWFVTVPEVRVGQPSRGPAVRAVYATGVVEPVTWAKVAPLVKGRIVELCACESEAVKRGDVLGRLEDNEMRAELRQYEADARFLEDEMGRKKTLADKGLASRQAYDQAVSAYRQAEAAVAAARERLEHYVLRAPMDGVVLRRDGEVGEVVDTGDVVFWVGQERPLRITADVDEEDIGLVHLGQQALIKADAFPGRVLEGTLAEITPKGDPVNKTYRVRVALPDDTPLLIGMTTEVNVVVEEKADALLVPRGALADGRLWVVEDGRVHPRAVRAGIVGDSMAEILDGVDADARIVLDPPETLEPRQRVRAREAVASGGAP